MQLVEYNHHAEGEGDEVEMVTRPAVVLGVHEKETEDGSELVADLRVFVHPSDVGPGVDSIFIGGVSEGDEVGQFTV